MWGTPSFLATVLTGDSRTVKPLPCGRSGWVKTLITSSPQADKLLRLGQAKSDVPINTMRQGFRVMRNLRRSDSFDIVLNLYTSFGFFSARDDDKLVLDNVYSSLKPGGRLLMDMMGKEILTRVFQERSWSEIDGVIYLEERKIEDGWEMIRDKCTIIQDGNKKEYTFRHRIYSGVELSSLLHYVGFESVKVVGDLKGNPYDNTAKRLVAVATK